MTGIIIISLIAIVILFLGLYKLDKAIVPLAVVGLLASITSYALAWNTNIYYFNNMLFVDNFAILFSILTIATTILILLLSPGYFEKISSNVAEYVALILFSLVGVLCMVSYNNFSMLFIGIEIMSISMYIMAGIRKKDLASNEAALKYFLMGSFATGFLLFGIALVYGFTGSFNLETISTLVNESGGQAAALFVAGILFMIVGMSFKVSAAPFHFWAPDVYDGAPSLVTSYMSSVVKTASFAAFIRMFIVAFAGVIHIFTPTLWALAAITIIVGNVIALYQDTFKRMLAYSSISHAGYMLIAILALGPDSGNAIFYYAVAYSIASVSAFAILIKVKALKNSESFDAFN
jgi:NADH-quinone oxidoreductase subunit N